MLRLLSPRIFREGPKEYTLPMLAFEDIDDVFKNALAIANKNIAKYNNITV